MGVAPQCDTMGTKGGIMAGEYRNTLRKLAKASSVEEKIALFNRLADDLDERFNKMNNQSGIIIAQFETTLNIVVEQLRIEIDELKSLRIYNPINLDARLKKQEQHDQLIADKIHAMSNFLTILEGKLNDLIELTDNE